MIPKLRIKLHEAVLRGKSSDRKARAAGYTHTYFDHEGLDLAILSTYPTDDEIELISEEAAQEADSLVALLGIDPDMLHRPHHAPSSSMWLPSISSWIDDSDLENEDSDNDSEEIREAEELQKILDNEESSPISRGEKIDQRCLNLMSAALAIASEEATIVYVNFFSNVCVDISVDFFSAKISRPLMKSNWTLWFLKNIYRCRKL
jgi:hypothetical protein